MLSASHSSVLLSADDDSDSDCVTVVGPSRDLRTRPFARPRDRWTCVRAGGRLLPGRRRPIGTVDLRPRPRQADADARPRPLRFALPLLAATLFASLDLSFCSVSITSFSSTLCKNFHFWHCSNEQTILCGAMISSFLAISLINQLTLSSCVSKANTFTGHWTLGATLTPNHWSVVT